MAIPPSSTYKSVNPPEVLPRSTTPSPQSSPPECIHGVDWIGLDPRAVTSSVGAMTLRTMTIPEEEAPIITEINPANMAVPGVDGELIILGEGFTQESIIVWNNGDELTEFVSDTELRTIVKPSTVQAPLPFELSVYVRNGNLKSNVVSFTFVEADIEEEETRHVKARKHH